MTPALVFAIAVLGTVLVAVSRPWRAGRRAEFIRRHALPKGLLDRLQQRRPGLGTKEAQRVAQALRQFFLAHLKMRIDRGADDRGDAGGGGDGGGDGGAGDGGAGDGGGGSGGE